MDEKRLQLEMQAAMAMINLICNALADQTSLIYDQLQKCDCCERPATVKHVHKPHHTLCDRCCAEVIIKARAQSVSEPNDTIGQLALITVDEASWRDSTYAKSIRNLLLFFEQFENSEFPVEH